jgi:hypothetical protein
MILAYLGAADAKLCEYIAIDHFISALKDSQLELKLREREPVDLDSALRFALRLEAYSNAYDNDNTSDESKRIRRERNRAADRLARRVDHIEKSIQHQGDSSTNRVREQV